MCLDPYHSIGANGNYTGHDEPTVQFTRTGRERAAGPDLPGHAAEERVAEAEPGRHRRHVGLPAAGHVLVQHHDVRHRVVAELHQEVHAEQRRKRALPQHQPESPHYIGKSPGNAFMELQFYAPGWVPQFAGFGCSATKWCANLTIDSLSDQDNTGVPQNADCLNNHFLVGEEPVNWAYITKSGKSQAPANPLALSDDPTLKGLNPDLSKDLLMNPGDTLRVHMHDTQAGYRIDITDLTTGQHGSMTASKANGFGQVLFQPKAKTCHVRPYAFHPMYGSAVPRGSTWGAHTTNVGASDEIGHFEYCNAIDPTPAPARIPAPATRRSTPTTRPAWTGRSFGALIPIMGCLLDDGDFDGPSYQLTGRGRSRTRRRPAAARHAVPVHRADLARQAARERLVRDRPAPHRAWRAGHPSPSATGNRRALRQPAGGREVLSHLHARRDEGQCWLQQGGAHVPGTVNTFGGSSATEYGRAAVRPLCRRRLPADQARRGLPPRSARQPLLRA